MATEGNVLRDRLSRHKEITISVTGRKSGHKISIPVWFVFEGGTLYLVPVQGSDTQWYKNVLKNPTIRLDVGGERADLKVALLADSKQVKSVVEKFREKYGAGDVKKYYSKFDVAFSARVA